MNFFCNLQSRAQTHAILVIGLYELLGNPTTQLIEPPQALSHFGKRLYILCRCTIYDYKEYNTVLLIIGVTGYINYWWNDYGFHIKNLMNLFKTLARGGHHQICMELFFRNCTSSICVQSRCKVSKYWGLLMLHYYQVCFSMGRWFVRNNWYVKTNGHWRQTQSDDNTSPFVQVS
jgi:hypothetical protein